MGLIIEVYQFDQYIVLVNGSGRLSIHDCKFLRKYLPVQAQPPRCTIDDDLWHVYKLPAPPNPIVPSLPATTKPPPAKPLPAAAIPSNTYSSNIFYPWST